MSILVLQQAPFQKIVSIVLILDFQNIKKIIKIFVILILVILKILLKSWFRQIRLRRSCMYQGHPSTLSCASGLHWLST